MNSTHKVKCQEELWNAALNNNETIITSYEGDINAETPLGNTALHIAASGGCLNAVKALLDRGAKVDCMDKDALTPLFKAVQENEELVADYLISFGATTVGRDETGMSLLHWAAKNGMDSIIEQLLINIDLKHVNTIDSKDECGKTPLHFACHEGHLSTVSVLLRFGASPSSKDQIHWTPLHEAAFWNNLLVVRCLLEAGVDINPVTEDGETPLNFSHYNGHAAVSEFLRINVKGRNYEIASHLLNKGADPFILDSEKATLLHHAAYNGMTRLVQQLLEEQKLDPLAKNSSEELPLHMACSGGHVDIVKILLSYNFSQIDCMTNESSYTPLHEAAFWGKKKVVKFLLDNNASINARTFLNQTPMTLAKICGHTYVSEFIRSKGGILEGEGNTLS